MNFKTVSALYKKEMLDIFRDKKTIIIMLVVPLLLYPVIFFAAAQISVSIMTEAQQKSYDIALDFDEGRDRIADIINDDTDEYDYSLNIVENISDYKQALEDKKISAYVSADSSNGKTTYTIYYLSSDSDSANAAPMIQDILLEYRNQLRTEKLEDAGFDADSILYPIEVNENDTASSEQSVGYLLGTILPLILVIIIAMSATYPAIDITAGEKERGTLETMLTLPISGKEIFTSKFMAVSTITIFSAFLNILSMGIMTGFMYKSIIAQTQEIKINISSFIPALVVVVFCVIIFAMFISAVTMGICAMAKSFKEAQNYMTPFLLILMIAGYISFIPSIKLTMTTAIIPVLNISLMIKQLLAFEYDIASILLVFLSNIIYAMISTIILSRIYDSESIMFGDSGKELKIFEKRADIKAGGTPGTGDAVIILLICITAMFYISSVFVSKSVLLATALPQCFFAVICLASAFYLKCDIKKTFSVKRPAVKQLAGGIFLGAGMICLNMIFTMLLSLFMKDSLSTMNNSMDIITNGHGFAEILFVVGIIPAVCEEILFRGYFYSSIKNKFKPIHAMIIVSLVFGIYHMNLIQSTVTAVIGMMLVFAVYRTDCIFISMIMHCMNNSFSVISMYFPENPIIKALNEISSPLSIAVVIITGIASSFLGIYLTKSKS